MMNKDKIYQIIEAETYAITLQNENLGVSGIHKCSEKLERYFNEDTKEKDNLIEKLQEEILKLNNSNDKLQFDNLKQNSIITDLNFKLSYAKTNYNELKEIADEMANAINRTLDGYLNPQTKLEGAISKYNEKYKK